MRLTPAPSGSLLVVPHKSVGHGSIAASDSDLDFEMFRAKDVSVDFRGLLRTFSYSRLHGGASGETCGST